MFIYKYNSWTQDIAEPQYFDIKVYTIHFILLQFIEQCNKTLILKKMMFISLWLWIFGSVQSEQKWLIISNFIFSLSQYLTTQILHSHSAILDRTSQWACMLYWIGSPVITHNFHLNRHMGSSWYYYYAVQINSAEETNPLFLSIPFLSIPI